MESQLDRIERKMDEVLAFRDLLMKLALPRLPAPMRAKVLDMAASRPR